MKQFLTGLVIFSIAVVVVIFICNRNYYPAKAKGNDGYTGAIIDKHARADKIKSPRIFFCGGSNVAFGIDGKRIGDSLGIPAVNFGLLGSLGLQFMLNEVKAVARPTDIVVLSPEYDLTLEGDHAAKKEAQRIFPEAGKYFEVDLKQRLTDFFIEDLQKNFTVTLANLFHRPQKGFPANVVYARTSFSEYGDVVRNFTNPSKGFLAKPKLVYKPHPGIGAMNDFKAHADRHNIRVYFLFPPLPKSYYERNSDVIRAYADGYSENLKIPRLNRPTDAVFADSLFYDTEYHLKPNGKELRTERIIPQLKKALQR